MIDRQILRAILAGDDPNRQPAPVIDEATQVLCGELGHDAVGWVTTAVEQGTAAVRDAEGSDALAPWPEIQVLMYHLLVEMLLDLAGVPTPPGRPTEPINRRLAVDIIARDVQTSLVVEALRMMQRGWIDSLVERVLRTPAGVAAVAEIAAAVTTAVDRGADGLLTAIDAERNRVFLSGDARSRQVIEALVAGTVVDEQAAGEALGIALDGWHLGVVVDAEPGSSILRRDVDQVGAALLEAAGGGSLVRYATSDGRVWIWVSGRRPIDRSVTEALAFGAPLVVGVGEPHEGAPGFRRTHREASDALDLGLGLARPLSLRHHDVALLTLLNQDRERASWFVESELGALTGDSAEIEDLRSTLRAFLDSRMRIAPASQELFLHRNTLRARLRRIEGLLGHRIADRSAEIRCALLLHELFAASPPAVARPALSRERQPGKVG